LICRQKTGASHADRKLPDWAPDVKFIGLEVLVDLGGGDKAATDIPVEKRGISDDLKSREKGRVKKGGFGREWP
jgi:hypothetical protein